METPFKSMYLTRWLASRHMSSTCCIEKTELHQTILTALVQLLWPASDCNCHWQLSWKCLAHFICWKSWQCHSNCAD